MSTFLQRRLKRAGQILPVLLLPLAAQAQVNYKAANALNVAGTYTDLATTGTAIATANTDDDNSAAQPIGFTFNFNGTAFTQFVLSTNGFIKLGNTAPSAVDLFLPESQSAPQMDPFQSTDAADVNIIAPFNFDLTAGSAAGGAEYRVATTGTAPNRVCTIQWKNVADKTLEYELQYGSLSFQVKLYETSNTIEFVYGSAVQGPNADDYRYALAGLKGTSLGPDQSLVVTKPGTGDTPWNAAIFEDEFYSTNDAFNFSGAVRPDAGRTYRFVTGAVVAITNDEPSGAIALPLGTTCTPITANNTGATTTTPSGYANPGCGIAVNPKDVWFTFTTAASGVGSTFVNLTTTGTAAGQVRVFSAASNAGPFTAVACAAGTTNNTSAGTLSVSGLTPGTTYYVSVSGYGSGDMQGAFTICLTGAATLAPPTYATLPYTEGFEGPWATATSTRDVPTLSWRNNPSTGNASWRREDDGFASANWSYESEETGATPYPTAASTGTHSARFHTYGVASGGQGKLDLYVNLGGTAAKTLTFDYINPTGTDQLEVLLSTDGGATFGTAPLLTATTASAFTSQSVALPGNSPTAVIRFQATSDFGDDDLGIDNLRIGLATATRNAELTAAVTLAPNPAQQRFTLSVPAGSLRTATATLANVLGQTVQTRQLSLPAAGGTADFDVSRLAPGIYTLTLRAGHDLVVKRVVVE